MPIVFALLTFISTLLGGFVGLKYRDKLHIILGYTAGVLLAVVAFEILPEIITLVGENHVDPIIPMIALVIGFLIFHILEKMLLIHHAQEEEYGHHKHPTVGILSALALSGHSFLDGIGIGLGFQISPEIGILITIAVISHDFTDGLNTVTLALINKNSSKKAFLLLLLDAIAPVLGFFASSFFSFPGNILVIYLGFFAGFLLYIGASEILPEAHSQHSSIGTILMTILGVISIFLVTRIV
ncbi:MAG: ZIP family metal transporter [Candidatus Daviesbacteria bacterium]|nr:ZIP family metal transporter [Candidatus Daviesbacteria bacterium]